MKEVIEYKVRKIKNGWTIHETSSLNEHGDVSETATEFVEKLGDVPATLHGMIYPEEEGNCAYEAVRQAKYNIRGFWT